MHGAGAGGWQQGSTARIAALNKKSSNASSHSQRPMSAPATGKSTAVDKSGGRFASPGAWKPPKPATGSDARKERQAKALLDAESEIEQVLQASAHSFPVNHCQAQ